MVAGFFIMMSKTRFFLIGIIAVYLLRFILSLSMGLMPQDAYYYFYSEHLALSYFDHPPMVACMLKFFSLIFGKSVWAVKLTDFMVTLFSFSAFYYLSSFFLPKERNLKTLFFYATTFLLTIISINTTPDVPLVFFWTLSLISIYKAVFKKKILFWILSGILMGLAFDSKYTALFLPFGLIIFLVLSKDHRHYLFSKELLLTVMFFAVTVSPVFIWNIRNNWISFAFQSSERAGSITAFNLSPKLFLGNLGTQLLILLPVLFIGMVIILWKYLRRFIRKRAFRNEKDLFLLSFSLPIILFFFGISLFYWVKLNWIMPGYIAVIILIARYISYKWLKIQIIISLVFHLLFLAEVVFYPVPVKSDDTWYGWEELSTEVKTIQETVPDSFIFANDGYKTSAILDFFLEDEIYAGNILGEFALQFSIVYPDLNKLDGKNAIFIDSDKRIKDLKRSKKIPEKLKKYFKIVDQLDPVIIRNKKGKAMRKFYIYKCMDYQSNANH